ncbi:MAG: 50S ribosomal protein L10 [Candidatus Babeliales bacterium]|jgi:large subunit ribosomal protein L10
MNRHQKEAAVAEVRELFSQTQATFLVNYQGMSVSHLQSLRRALRENNGVLKVTKATLMKKATHDIVGVDNFSAQFKDQVGLVFAKGDISSVAKQLKTFSEQNEALKLLSGFFEARVLSQQEVAYLASLPARDVLLAQVVGTVQAPIASFVRLLNLLTVRLLYVLKEIEAKTARQ